MVKWSVDFKEPKWADMGFPGGASGKDPACQCRRRKRFGFDPCVGKIPWGRAWQPTPVFLPGESHGQWSLVGYSPWAAKSWTQLSDSTSVLLQMALLHYTDFFNDFFVVVENWTFESNDVVTMRIRFC